MKIIKLIIIGFCLLNIACNNTQQNKDIETVKNSPLELGLGLTNKYMIGDLVKEIAGIKGSVSWESFHPEKFKDNPNTVCVQVNITRNMENNNQIMMQYLLNRGTGFVQVGHLEVDSVGKSVTDFYMILMEIGIDNLE
jgi:hypothetical protein